MLILNLFYALDHSYYLLIIMDAKISTKQHFKRSLSKALIPTLSLCSIKKKLFKGSLEDQDCAMDFFLVRERQPWYLGPTVVQLLPLICSRPRASLFHLSRTR